MVKKKKILLIGDVHGKALKLENILIKNPDYDYIIQLGDLGIGFNNALDFVFEHKIFSYSNFYFIRGNHDSPKKCFTYDNYLGNYGVFNKKIFYISGAYSIDQNLRTEGIDYWNDEELSYEQSLNVLRLYIKTKPQIVISHTCPESMIEELSFYKIGKSRTQQLLQIMFEKWQPKLWVFGHFHKSWNKTIDGCKMQCLNEMEVLNIDV